MKKLLYVCLAAVTLGLGAQAASSSSKHASNKTKHKVKKQKKRMKTAAKKKSSVSKKSKKTVQTKKKPNVQVENSKAATVAAALGATAVSPGAENNISAGEAQAAPKAEKKNVTVTRGDIKVLEATENIRFLSQQIVKEYLFLFKTPRPDVVKEEIKGLLVALSNNLRVIAATTKDSDTKDILEFLAYSKDQIAQILTEKRDEEQAALMMDYSETLLEGADSIAAAHVYDFTKEEQMLMTTKQMEYLVERIMKYYIALHVGFDNPTNRDRMHEAIVQFGDNLQKIKTYSYPKKIKTVKDEMIKSWLVNENYFGKSSMLFIPKLMLLSTAHLEDLVTQIALYHTKNL